MVTTTNDWLQTIIGAQLEPDLFDQLSSLPFPGIILGTTPSTLSIAAAFAVIYTSPRHYIGIETLIMATIGTCSGVVTWLFSVSFPCVWRLLNFVLNFIPSRGSLIVMLAVFRFSLAQFGDLGYGPWILLVVFGSLTVPSSLMGPSGDSTGDTDGRRCGAHDR